MQQWSRVDYAHCLRQHWRQLAKWQRRLLMTVGVLVCTVWIGIGSAGLIALFESSLGCPPTMGCPEPTPNNCSWCTLLQPALNRLCDAKR
jgi:hypothetical protein